MFPCRGQFGLQGEDGLPEASMHRTLLGSAVLGRSKDSRALQCRQRRLQASQASRLDAPFAGLHVEVEEKIEAVLDCACVVCSCTGSQ